MDKSKIMNKREEKIMDFLWNCSEPRSVADMEEHFSSEDIGKVTVFKAVQSLEAKGYIRVNGVEKTGKTYARKFEPNITKEGYAAVILTERGLGSESIGKIALAMIGDVKGKKTRRREKEGLIMELRHIIDELSDDES